MMNKTFLTAWSVVFILWFIGSFIVHGVLLHDDYAQLPDLFRPEGESRRYFPLMLLAHIIMAGAFVWIYARGSENKPWVGQGLRFGAAIALLTVVSIYAIYFVVQPMPGSLVIKQIVLGGILSLILGMAAAYVYRAPRRA
jgi:hypothetical protein